MFISSNGIMYHVEVVGEGEPIVFLHGFTGDLTTWYQITRMLRNRYKCVLIDLIGHGKTDSPEGFLRYNLETVSQDIMQILDVLHITKTHLLGYSMGGRLALATAVLFPTRIASLILESSSPGLRTEKERAERRNSDELLASQIEKDGVERFIDYWENIPLFASQKTLTREQQQEIRKQRLGNNPVGLANSLRGMGTGAQLSYWERLHEIHVPTLLICGELDQKFCTIAKEMSTRIQTAKVEKVEDTGHAIHVEQPQFFGKIVDEFVSDHISS